jgi:hypothetical protein
LHISVFSELHYTAGISKLKCKEKWTDVYAQTYHAWYKKEIALNYMKIVFIKFQIKMYYKGNKITTETYMRVHINIAKEYHTTYTMCKRLLQFCF